MKSYKPLFTDSSGCTTTVQGLNERTNDVVKDCGLRHVRARGRVHTRIQAFFALCLRLVVAITNDDRGNDPGREMLKL